GAAATTKPPRIRARPRPTSTISCATCQSAAAPDPMIGRNDVEAAWSLIRPYVRRTPALELPKGSLGLRQPLALQLESLQVRGSFKGRGASHKLLASDVPEAGISPA